jgi:hypothetical protein
VSKLLSRETSENQNNFLNGDSRFFCIALLTVVDVQDETLDVPGKVGSLVLNMQGQVLKVSNSSLCDV